jgi:hypothetical protein
VKSHAKAPSAGSTQRQTGRLGIATLAVAFFALLALAPTALAAPSRTYSSSFGAFSSPEALTVDHSGTATDGDVYVLDTAEGKVSRFTSAGAADNFTSAEADISANSITGFSFESNAAQVAVAPAASPGGTAGDIYVVSSITANVQVFAPNGDHIATLNGSGDANGGFGEVCGVAVDTTGAVYVGEYSGYVWRYTPGAGTVDEADYSGGIKTPMEVCNVAAAAGSVYAGNTYAGGELRKFQASDFTTAATPPSPSSTLIDATATAAAASPSNGDVYVDEGNKIQVFDSTGAASYSFGSSADFGSNSNGVAVAGPNANAYVADRANGEVDVFGAELNPPTATTEPATAVHHTSAVLNGHFDLGGDTGIVACHFEWGTTAAYGDTVPCNEGNSFAVPADVTGNIGFLTPGTPIHFRLDVTGATSGEVQGEDQSFTPPDFPAIHPEIAAFGSDGTSATTSNNVIRLAFDQANRRLYGLSYLLPGGAAGPYGFDASAPPVFTPLNGFNPLSLPHYVNSNPDIATGSSGDVYVASEGDGSGASTSEFPAIVYGFSPTGTPLGGNFPIDPAITPGAPAGGPNRTLCGIATDSAGSIWVANQATEYILKYSSSGVFQSALDVSAHGSPCDLAFDSNDDLYVKQSGVWRYTAASGYATAMQVVPSSSSPRAVAVDPSTHRLYIARSNAVDEFDSSGNLLSTFATGIGGASFESLAVDAVNHYVYVADLGGHQIRVFGPGVIQEGPTITPKGPTGISGHSATLNALVDPETFAVTDCHFDYGTTTSYGHTAPCSPSPGSGSGDVAVSAALSGLEPGTVYHFRISAANVNGGPGVNGTSTGADQTLATLGPQVQGGGADQILTTGARLNAKVNPEGKSTNFHFEYGATTAYGHSTPESAPVGFDASSHAVFSSIAGLSPGTTYHFRVVATNSDATTNGPDATFATYPSPPSFGPCPNDQLRSGFAARLPDCRAYEQVTPTDKHGANAQGQVNLTQASSSGDRITFFTNGGLPTTGGSSGLAPFMASRNAGGWGFDGLLPATEPGSKSIVTGWSEDLATAIVAAPGSGGIGSAFYLRDSASAAFQLGADGTGGLENVALDGFATDTRHLIFESTASLLPSAPSSGIKLYDLDHGNLTLVGRVPAGAATSCDDESVPACEVAPGGSVAGAYEWFTGCPGGGASCLQYVQAQNAISRDGSKIFFTDLENKQLYVREDGSRTTQVSASQRTTPDPGGVKPATFMAATSDGSEVLFASCEKLTDDSTASSNGEGKCNGIEQGQDLYSYDIGSGELTDLTFDSNAGDAKGAAVLGVLGTSEDGSYVYFAANGVLAPGASPGNCVNNNGNGQTCNLYVRHNGATTFIARVRLSGLDNTDEADWIPLYYSQHGTAKTSRVSADGRTLLFSSIEDLTGYDNSHGCSNNGAAPCAELYRYSAPEEELACVSCNPTGAAPSDDAVLGTPGRIASVEVTKFAFLTRNLSADGKRVFFESKDALLSTDTNGVRDVYEWEAGGAGSCETAAGCLYLISSGTSPEPSYFADASTNGDHAFFFTGQQLVPGDLDQLVDIYDAAAGGGLASQHSLAPPTCTGVACQANPAPPPDPTLGSAVFSGAGNAHERSAARKCPQGKRRVRRAGKVRCEKAHKQHKRHSNRGGSK